MEFRLIRRGWPRRLVATATALLVLVGLWCVVVAGRPGNDPFAAKAADWFRDHHLESVANWVERQWYTHQQPSAGGVPQRAIELTDPPVPVASPPARDWSIPPPPIAPLASTPLPNEGVWNPIGPLVDGHPAMSEAQLRPD